MSTKTAGNLKKEIIDTGKRLYELRLLAASSGNLSARADKENIIITSAGALLGSLQEKDLVEVNLNKKQEAKEKGVTSEFPLHSLIYENFPKKVIIHCHPALTNAYFAVYPDIKVLTFETKLYLGNVPVVKQDTPAVTKPEEVVKALKASNLVVLKNHGVVAIADSFSEAFNLIEMLEEAVRIAAVARIFKKDILDDLDRELKEDLNKGKTYEMFSKEHIQAIVDLVNSDQFIREKGKDLDLTVQLAIKLDDSDKEYRFTFDKGKIISLDADSNAPFVISAPKDIWEFVFLGKLDSFVAVTQGRMKLDGQLGQLARWYVPFSRLFQLFKEVKIST
ncbi:MAG: class II aldolase/adducin family protein [Candidatus Omnitrophica bacterium]|nr:class II aldolase/adducin family protein [Candidatus Omnitrophota bacterium]